MIGKPRPGRHRLLGLDSPEGEAVLGELERSEAIRIRTIVGINDDGVFGSTRKGWRPRHARRLQGALRPAALDQGPELLGRVPQGSTARFLEDGTLPD